MSNFFFMALTIIHHHNYELLYLQPTCIHIAVKNLHPQNLRLKNFYLS